MTKTVYTSADIRRLAGDGDAVLELRPGDLVTPLALDDARQLGVSIRRTTTPDVTVTTDGDRPGSNGEAPTLEARVRAAVVAALAGRGEATGSAPEPAAAAAPPADRAHGRPRARHIPTRGLALDPFPFDIRQPAMDVRLRDVVTAADGSPMSAGFMAFRAGSFPWHLDYDEVELVLEGELHLGTPDGTIVAHPGDVVQVPKGTDVTFGTPSWVKLFYVTHPADWAGS